MKVRTHHNHYPSGAITPKTRWRLYADNPLAPLRRKQIGSYTPEIDRLVGGRDADYAEAFISDLAGRLANRVQLTSDGHKAYLNAVESAFGADVDYSMLVKLYGASEGNQQERRYSAGQCCGTITGTVSGDPKPEHVSTSFVERQNLSLRMGNRRFTRLTNGFSKKAENHAHALAIYYMHYNFGRIHKSLRVTPAMEAGVSNHVWSLEEIAKLAD